jgi:opacity protein-like surface antigen
MKIARAAVAIAAVLAVAPRAVGDEASEKAAVAAAESWLRTVDAGQYGASWDDAARTFKKAVSKADWEQALERVRAPLGDVVRRKLTSRTYTESLPGAPDGKYLVLQYATSFRKKETAIETVTPMLDEDGEWRISGYFIK